MRSSFWLLLLIVVCGHATQNSTELVQDSHAGQDAARQKVYSIADLHGDYEQFKMILQQLGLASFEGRDIHWTGGNSILVSTGDTVDRGEHSRPIYLAFQILAQQAPNHGGEVINILGNHELMNLGGDLRYVPPEEMESGGDYGGQDARANEWGPTGIIGRDLRARYVGAAMRAGTVFVHAGLDPSILRRYGSGPKALDNLNAKVRELINSETVDHVLLGEDGPFWNRFLAIGQEKKACEKVELTLRMLGADRMVMGHTPQRTGVNVRCEGPAGPRVILADTFISAAYGMSGGRASAVEYSGNSVTALYFPEDEEEVERFPLTASIDV